MLYITNLVYCVFILVFVMYIHIVCLPYTLLYIYYTYTTLYIHYNIQVNTPSVPPQINRPFSPLQRCSLPPVMTVATMTYVWWPEDGNEKKGFGHGERLEYTYIILTVYYVYVYDYVYITLQV